ncbi:hypothetical protein HZS_3668 [Henneguya salminicola]|nr:hypothetical protein HZS_3668 [Henneguya salminicola]
MDHSTKKQDIIRRVEKLVHGRWEVNKDVVETLNKYIRENSYNSAHKNGDMLLYDDLACELDQFSNSLKNLKNCIDKEFEFSVQIENYRENAFFHYLTDLHSNKQQLEFELKTMEQFTENFQLVEEDYRIIFDKNAPLIVYFEYIRILDKINHIRTTVDSLTDNSYTSVSDKLISQMNNLYNKSLQKMSEILKKMFEVNESYELLNDDNFVKSLRLLTSDMYLFRNCLLGYISHRRSRLLKLYHNKFTHSHYRNILLHSSAHSISNIENVVDFVVENIKNETTIFRNILAKISYNKDSGV